MKSYISRKFPLETRTTDQTFDFRSAERLIGSSGSQLWPFVKRRRWPPTLLNSPQSSFGHAVCPPETAGLTLPKVEHGRWESNTFLILAKDTPPWESALVWLDIAV